METVNKKNVFAFVRWVVKNGWKIDSEDNLWFRECEDELTPDMSIGYTDKMLWSIFLKLSIKE